MSAIITIMPQAAVRSELDLLKDNMQSILDMIRIFVVAVDQEGDILYTNPYFLTKMEYTSKDVLGHNIYKKFITPEKSETFEKNVQAVLDKRYSIQTEGQLLTKSGQIVYVEWHTFPIIEQNKVLGVLVLGIDITSQVEMVRLVTLNEQTMRQRASLYESQNIALEKLETELHKEKKSVEEKVESRTKELNEEKARLLASINSFPYGLLVTDTEDNVVIANDRLGDIFGVKKVEWNINNLRDFLSGSINFMKYYGMVKTTRAAQFINNVDLERKFLNIYIAPIFLNPLTNEIIGNVVLVTDITEQKIIERSKEEFFSIASHELRTPLTAIRGNAELIKKHYQAKVKDEAFNQMIDDIETSSERLISLVNEFLNMSRLEQGKMQFDAVEFDLTNLLFDVIGELTNSAAQKGLYIKVTPEKLTPIRAFADPDRTREVLLNLISNAISYTEKGGCTVSVSVEMRKVVVKVSDTGKGIPSQNQNLLFRKFQQANQSIYSRDASRSTGLGLYISKLMVEAMRGSIYLEKSQVGVGSVFVFTLPIA